MNTNPKKNIVVLVFPKISGNLEIRVLPFGLLSIASSLRKAGFEPKIVDLNCDSQERLFALLAEHHARTAYVGFSVFTGPMIQAVLSISERIKKTYPDLPLVWGGPHPTIMPELTLAHPLVDIVACGEGEKTAVRLAESFGNGSDPKNIQGIAFKKNNEIIFTSPAERIPAERVDEDMSLGLDQVDLEKYVFRNKGKRTAIFLTSRGCPYRCSFCWNSMFHKRRYTAWSPKKVRSELEPLKKTGIEKILLFDSFIGSAQRVLEIGGIFKQWGLEWAIEDGCRVDYHSTPEFFKGIEDAGCTHVAFGAESGSRRILEQIKKDIKVEDIVRSAEARISTRVAGRYQWMTGIPGETKEDTLKTVRLIDQISKINPRSAHSMELYLPYPGNELYEQACQMGWQPPKDLEGWGTYRWQGRYPYHKEGTWFFKSVQYSNFFLQYKKLAAVSAFCANIKPLLRLVNFLFLPFAALRWKTRRFGFPVEYRTAESLRRFVER